MGIIVSQTEQNQFIAALRASREAGWSDADIARTLCVSNGDFKNMLTGHKTPSQKHIDRLNNLMHSSPPRRITKPPPAPSRPAMALPDFVTGTPEKPAGQLYVGDDAPRTRADVTSAPAAEPPKENTDMTTTEAANDIMNGAKKGAAVDNRRYLHIPTSESKALRRAMNEAFEVNYGGQRGKMAEALHMTGSGLHKVLAGKGAISELTRDQFTKLTGWRFSGKAVSIRKHINQAVPHTRRRLRTSLEMPELAKLRDDLEKAITAESGNKTLLASKIGVDRNTITGILAGKGASQDTLMKFRQYQERLGKTIATARKPPPATSEPVSVEGLDLYQMAGRCLAMGRTSQAELLSLVARLSEGPAVEQVNAVLRRLLPNAAAG